MCLEFLEHPVQSVRKVFKDLRDGSEPSVLQDSMAGKVPQEMSDRKVIQVRMAYRGQDLQE